MPIMELRLKGGRKGYRWGAHGKIYPTREQAEKQAAAAFSNSYTGDVGIAFERLSLDKAMSVRTIDQNGYLRVQANPLTKSQVVPYYGHEIVGAEEHGLEPDQIYYVYRPAAELEKALHAFDGVPLLMQHQQDSAENPLKDLRVGSIGTSPEFDGVYLRNALIVTDQEAIDAINNGSLKEISAGYYYTPKWESGEFEGNHYDLIQTDIRGNHISLVESGRAGKDCAVMDSNPIKPIKVQKIMQLTRKQVAVRATLAAYLKPRLTMDAVPADLTKLVGSYKKPSTLVKAVVRQYGSKIAQDMDIEPEELAELMEAAEQVVEPEEKGAVDPDETIYDEDNVSESLKAMLEGKVPDEVLAKVLACVAAPTGDEDLTEEEKAAKEKADKEKADAEEAAKKKKEGEPAMDANTIKLQARTEAQDHFRNLNEAGRKVRELVGEVDVMAFDSAEDIYGHALKQKGVKIAQYDKSAYKGMVDMLSANQPATKPAPVMDASLDTFEGPFKGLGNININ